MTLKEVKDIINDMPEIMDDLPTNVRGIHMSKDGIQKAHVTFAINNVPDKKECLIDSKQFLKMLTEYPEFLMDKLITNVTSITKQCDIDGMIFTLHFEIDEKDKESLTGKEIIEVLEKLDESDTWLTNIENIYFLSESTMCPKLLINRPDLMELQNKTQNI